MSFSLLAKTSLRYLLRHPWQFGLCILGVALGVAVVVAIDLANSSARAAFRLSTESLAGNATHQVIGGPNGFDEALYRQIRAEQGIRASAPVVTGYASMCAQASCENGKTVQILGVDPFAEGAFRQYLSDASFTSPTNQGSLTRLLTEPNSIIIAEASAQNLGISAGDNIFLRVGGVSQQTRVVGILSPQDKLSQQVIESLVLTDIASAQDLFMMAGRLSRIDLTLSDREVEQIGAILPASVELVEVNDQSATIEQMTQAFELNLSALSLLALIVGTFLIYNTITFSIVQRRGLIGTLRCLGVTRRQIFTLVLSEAAVTSLIGALLGLGLGIALGRGLVGLITQSINDLYFVMTVRSFQLNPIVLLKGALLGIGATLLAALAPAFEATATEPRSVLRRSSIEEGFIALAPRATLFGLLLLVLSLGLLLLPSNSLFFAFAGLFGLVIGCAACVPLLTIALLNGLQKLIGRLFGLLGRMAARDVVASLSRTSIAIAALMIAVSVIIGVGTMVGSFRTTVVDWLDQTIQADIYVATPSHTANRVDSAISLATVESLSELPGIVGRSIIRNVLVNGPAGPVQLIAVEQSGQQSQLARDFLAGDPNQAWDALPEGAIIISEPFSYRSGLGLGDQLSLRSDQGEQRFPIVGVIYDYSSDRGSIFMARSVYQRYWQDEQISSVSFYVAPNSDIEGLIEQMYQQVGEREELVISSNRGLRAGTLEVFDRTFAITSVLQLLATIVAFIGILSALMALQLERAQHLGVLRAIGLTPRQLWAMVLSQTSLMGLIAGVLAMPLGIALSLILIYVINRRSFGWTLQLTLEPSLFLQALIIALIAAFLAGIYPAFAMSRTSPALALREE
jgi:putative ABC transport system permease protein